MSDEERHVLSDRVAGSTKFQLESMLEDADELIERLRAENLRLLDRLRERGRVDEDLLA